MVSWWKEWSIILGSILPYDSNGLDVKTARFRHVHQNNVNIIVIDCANKHMASASDDKIVVVWHYESGML